MGLITNLILSIFILSQNAHQTNTLRCFLSVSGKPVTELDFEIIKYPNESFSKYEKYESNGECFMSGFGYGYYFLIMKNIHIDKAGSTVDGGIIINENKTCCLRVSLQDVQGKPLRESSTGSDGTFHLRDIEPGQYQVLVSLHFTELVNRD